MHLIWIGFDRMASQSTSVSNYRCGNQLRYRKGLPIVQRERNHEKKCKELEEEKKKWEEEKKELEEKLKERQGKENCNAVQDQKNEVTDIL